MKYVIIFGILLVPALTAAQETASGELGGDAFWAGEILITGDVTVPQGVTLSIAPGTRILVAAKSDDTKSGKDSEHVEIIVAGTLLAQGLANAGQIVFTSNAPEPRMHDWYGIVLKKNSGATSVLRHSLIEYTYKGITCYGSSPTIDNCEVRYSLYAGISAEIRSQAQIRNTTLMANDFAGLVCELAAVPVVETCVISQNENGVVIFDQSQPNLGWLDGGDSQGRNIILNNFENNIYNDSRMDIYAQNNVWSTNAVAEIQGTFFDQEKDRSKGRVIFQPLFGGRATTPVAQRSTAGSTERVRYAEATPPGRSPEPEASTPPPSAASATAPANDAVPSAASAGRAENQPQESAPSTPEPAGESDYLASSGNAGSEELLRSSAANSPEATVPETTTSPDLTGQSQSSGESAVNSGAAGSPPPTQPPVASSTTPSPGPVVQEPLVKEPVIEAIIDQRRRQYLHRARPVYPSIYRKSKFEGKVLVEVVVGKDGTVTSQRVLKSDGEYFTEAALEAVKKFRYKPATFKGKPVSFKVVEPFIFKLK